MHISGKLRIATYTILAIPELVNGGNSVKYTINTTEKNRDSGVYGRTIIETFGWCAEVDLNLKGDLGVQLLSSGQIGSVDIDYADVNEFYIKK